MLSSYGSWGSRSRARLSGKAQVVWVNLTDFLSLSPEGMSHPGQSITYLFNWWFGACTMAVSWNCTQKRQRGARTGCARLEREMQSLKSNLAHPLGTTALCMAISPASWKTADVAMESMGAAVRSFSLLKPFAGLEGRCRSSQPWKLQIDLSGVYIAIHPGSTGKFDPPRMDPQCAKRSIYIDRCLMSSSKYE